jgi:dephospho-CoA kinase
VRVGLTGGVGSGKSTVALLLAARGAIVIDADALAREVVEPGTPGLAALVERFGAGIVTPDGALDRAALAGIAFSDDSARADLEAIVHPLVARRSAEIMSGLPEDAIVVYDVPLLVENDLAGDFDTVVVVEADVETRVRRLVRRGLSEEDARARIAVQASDDQRRAVADELLRNDGSRDELADAVDALWRRLTASS